MRTVTNPTIDPGRGEIWDIRLDPIEGMEIHSHGFLRPCLVLTADPYRYIRMRAVVPITGWNSRLEQQSWAVLLEPTSQNGLDKRSLALANQIRTVSLERFYTSKVEAFYRGKVTAEQLEEVTLAIGFMIEHP